MASFRQFEANRNNAQHSHGPTTDAGKAESAKNSFKTGLYSRALIIRGEKQEDFDALNAEYYEQYEPESVEERDWIDRIVRLTGSSAAMTSSKPSRGSTKRPTAPTKMRP